MAEPVEIVIPAPLAHQRPILRDPHRFKLVRAGRRFGKSRLALNAAVVGHGPERAYRGIAQGVDVAWIPPTIPQSRAIWREDILPRFAGVRGVDLNETEKRVTLGGGGTLEIRSAEAIESLRGRKLGGVIIDEAAHMDLAYVWRTVVRPALADLRGWAIIVSTTKIGSHFNDLCDAVERGQMSDSYTAFHGRTTDNPRLNPDEVAELYAEYPPGSTDAMQELEAELLTEHGELFKAAFWAFQYETADHAGMTVAGEWMPFEEIRMYVDLASSMKQTADFTAALIAGLTHGQRGGWRKAGILYVHNERLEGPAQLDLFARLLDDWRPTLSKLEAVQYQQTSVQHLKQRRPKFSIVGTTPDKDKRTRAVPWAAAMARGDVYWPRQASWLPLVVKQHLKFPNGAQHSTRPEDHDDIVDTGSMLGADLSKGGGSAVPTGPVELSEVGRMMTERF